MQLIGWRKAIDLHPDGPVCAQVLESQFRTHRIRYQTAQWPGFVRYFVERENVCLAKTIYQALEFHASNLAGTK